MYFNYPKVVTPESSGPHDLLNSKVTRAVTFGILRYLEPNNELVGHVLMCQWSCLISSSHF